MTEIKLPVPPFTYEDAVKKVRMAEDAWNTRNPDKVRRCMCMMMVGECAVT